MAGGRAAGRGVAGAAGVAAGRARRWRICAGIWRITCGRRSGCRRTAARRCGASWPRGGMQVFAAVFGSARRVMPTSGRGPGACRWCSGPRPGPAGVAVGADARRRRAAGAGGGRDLPEPAGRGLGATLEVPGGRLRVLMVISRPAGAADVGYQMIARPLLERLEAVRGQVDLMVLRPPTLEALRQALTRGRRCRGAVPGGAFRRARGDAGPLRRRGAGARPGMMSAAGEGVLAFEQPRRGQRPVSGVAGGGGAGGRAGCRWWC